LKHWSRGNYGLKEEEEEEARWIENCFSFTRMDFMGFHGLQWGVKVLVEQGVLSHLNVETEG